MIPLEKRKREFRKWAQSRLLIQLVGLFTQQASFRVRVRTLKQEVII